LQNFLWFIIVISVVVFVHEMGHFLFARYFGVKVEKFSIGFGPALVKFLDNKGTEWRISAIPLGGYVQMYGEENFNKKSSHQVIEEGDAIQSNISFSKKPLYQKSLIAAAGPIANYVLSALLFIFIIYKSGLTSISTRIDSVTDNSIAFHLGIEKDDAIISINQRVADKSLEDIILQTHHKENFSIALQKKSGKIQNIEVEFQENWEYSSDFFHDIKFQKTHIPLNFIQSCAAGIQKSAQISFLMIKGIYEMITGNIDIKSMGGPVAIAQYSKKAADGGYISLLWFIAIFSLNLGLLNLIPIPVLDGGQLFLYGIEAIIRRPIPEKIKAFIMSVGMLIVFFIMSIAIYSDFQRIFF